MKRFFPKGVFLSQQEDPDGQIIASYTPEKVLVPLYPRGVGMVPVNTQVKRGTLLGEEGGFAPDAGTIQEYREVVHPVLGRMLCAVLELGSKQQPRGHRSSKPPKGSCTPEEIQKTAMQAGIIDECSGELLWKRLRQMREDPPEFIAANALEDLPFLPGAAFFLQEQEKVLRGLEYLADAAGTGYRVAWNSRRVGDAMNGFPDYLSLSLDERYPAWRLYQKRHSGKSMLLGVQALAALADAVEKARVQTHTVIAVGGDALPKTQLLRVPIGTTVEDVLEFCGIGARPCHVAIGNVVSAVSVLDPETPITASCQSLTAWNPAEVQLDDRVFPCIGCGKCQRTCPMGLAPWIVQEALGQDPIPQNMLWRVEECVDCGACRAVCPSGIDLTACMKQARELRKRGGLA